MSEFTLGGYMAKHERAAAFEGADGQPYSVAIYVDDEPDDKGRYGAALLFVRWAPSGDRPVGHVETPVLATGATPGEANDRLEAWSLFDVKAALDEAIAAAPKTLVSSRRGTVLGRDGAAIRVLAGTDELRAVLRGRMKQQGLKVVAGDVVTLEPEAGGDLWGIIEVEPRRSVLERRIPGGRGTRAIAANIDRIFVVSASREPAPVPSVIDRLLVLAEANDVTPALVVNKVDLDPGTELIARYRAAGYDVFPISTRLGLGLDEIRGFLPGHASVFTGPSGAGKSSLLNALEPGVALRTAAVSEKIGRGMHTTVSALMVPLSGGGWLVDTPGFSEVGLWGLEARGLAECFPEMRTRLGNCRFQDCRHVTEPGCAIRAAVDEGAIHPDRYASYLLLLEETEGEPQDWE